MSIVSKASCLSRSRRSLFVSLADATPPLPVLAPALVEKKIPFHYSDVLKNILIFKLTSILEIHELFLF